MDDDKRARRVKRLKKEIIAFLLILILVPWVFVIVLSVKSHFMKKDLKGQELLLNEYLEQIEMLSSENMKNSPEGDELVSDKISPKHDVEALSEEEIERLSLSDEELYDGYRKVYLTFDDGPSSNTAAILDILKEYNVKATFFVIYKDGSENEELLRRIADEGHTLGMHSCTHVYSTVYGSEEAFMEDMETLRNFLYMVTGVESAFYRFPGGSSNRVSQIDMRTFARLLENEGIEYYDWNLSSGDASSPILSKEKIVRNVTKDLEKYNEAVILFHDTASKVTTVEALPQIIEEILAMDHTVILPISRETNPIQHISVE